MIQTMHFLTLVISEVIFVLTCGDEVQLPVIIWHGMGDHGSGAGIQELAEVIRNTNPGQKVKCISTGGGALEDIEDSYLKPCNKQIEQVCAELKSDPDFANGTHMIGLSQGGLFVRALAQRCPFDRLGSIVSIGGPQMGVFGVPGCRDLGPVKFCYFMEKLLSFGAYTSAVQKHLVQAQYWHDPLHEDVYRSKSLFLSDINQQQQITTPQYRFNLLKTKAFVLVKFTDDTILRPTESEWFGFYNVNSTDTTYELRDSQLYKQDLLGLQELDRTKRLHFLKVQGNHLEFTLEWFINEIVYRFLR